MLIINIISNIDFRAKLHKIKNGEKLNELGVTKK